MNQKTSAPYVMELRTPAGTVASRIEVRYRDDAKQLFAELARRVTPGRRLVMPATKAPMFEPDKQAWAASAARRKAGV